ncbi:MAG: AAA family ATPase, partial [Elusimicrobiota bacterium]
MRKDSLCARAVCLFLAAALASQPLNAAAAIATAPALIPSGASPSVDAAPFFTAVMPASAISQLSAPSLAAPALSPAPLPALAAAPVAEPSPVSAARALAAAAAPSAALTGPALSADGSKAEAGRSFDLSAAPPASDAGSVTGAETGALSHLAPTASLSGAMKTPPLIRAAKPRWNARVKAYAPRAMLAAGVGLAAWALHHLGMPPAASAAPLAFLAGTLGGSNRTPSPLILSRFSARVAEAASAGAVLTEAEAEVIGRSLELDSDQVQAAVAALMESGELGMRDNKVLVRYSFAARAAASSPIAAEREGDAAALAAVKLLNGGSARDHSNGLAAAAKALALYDQAAVLPPQRLEAEILRANLALEHLGDLLRLYQDVVETVKPEGDAYRVRRVKEIGEALDWLKTATYSHGHTPTMRRELHANLLSILKDVTPRDETGGQSEETVAAYVETVDLLEKYDPFYFLEGAAAAAPETPEEKLAHSFRDGILESTKPGAPVREALVSTVAGNLSLDAAGAKSQLSRMAQDGWIALRDNGTMIRVSVPGRVEGTPAGDRARKAHEAALEGVKLMNSSDPIDHLRAVSRLEAANALYTEYYSDREAPDNLFNEIQVLRGNAALETAGDVLRTLVPILQEHVSGADPFTGANYAEASTKLQRANGVLAWLNGAYYEADRGLEMPRETAEAMRDLLKLSSFRDFLKEKIQGDKELVRGVRLMREFAGLNVAQKGQAYQTVAIPQVPETPGGFRSLAANEFESLLRFGTDITQQAANGTLSPMIGRKAELRQIVKTLTRVKKNNPLLVGEPGVGKTELINGLARAIAAGEIPKLRGKNIVKIDIAAVVAGTTNRGMFEERLKNIIAEAKNSKGRILLFIDEIHMIVKAGDSEGGTTAAQILKDALSDGTLSLIGATTEGKELALLEKDGALLRRFNLIRLKAPSKADAEAIVEGVKAVYEKKHGVTIPAET